MTNSKTNPSKFKRYFSSLNYAGIVVGLFFVYASFLPSLLPRGWVLQGVLSGIVFCIGYAIGLVASFTLRQFKIKEPRPSLKRTIKIETFWLASALYLFFLILGVNWQKEVNELVGQTAEPSLYGVGTVIVSALIVSFIILIARSIRSLLGWFKKQTYKFLPKALAYALAWVVTFLLVVGIINGFIIENVMEGVNSAFSIKNDTTDEGVVKPDNPELSGSDQSLIAWETLGRQGRKFISKAQSAQDIGAFNQAEALNPVRVYSGLESAENTKDRAKLAVDDLRRAGGFQRQILVVVTTTGTGWVDENGVDPVEYMYNGNSAIVSMQYSYLPSWLSFLVDQSKAKEAGNELYSAVYDEWLKLPEDSRPKLVVFGESLGSFGSETAFPSQAVFKGISGGAVWVGPPNFNTLWRQATSNRDADSPEILPIVENGQTVRFVTKPEDLTRPQSDWVSPRAVYLQNPSDPIVWWSPKLLLQKPDWLKETRGSDVSVATRWLPIVTFFQVSGDMVFSTGVPDGHGHNYGKLPTDAWSYVAPPDAWTQQKTDALKLELSK